MQRNVPFPDHFGLGWQQYDQPDDAGQNKQSVGEAKPVQIQYRITGVYREQMTRNQNEGDGRNGKNIIRNHNIFRCLQRLLQIFAVIGPNFPERHRQGIPQQQYHPG